VVYLDLTGSIVCKEHDYAAVRAVHPPDGQGREKEAAGHG